MILNTTQVFCNNITREWEQIENNSTDLRKLVARRARVAIAIWQQVWERIWRIIFYLFSLSRGIRRVIFSWVQNQKYIKIQKKIILSHWIVLRSCLTIDDTYCQIEKYVVTKDKSKQNTNYNYSHLDNVLRLFSL
jgi:hypothetical protein